MKGEKFWAQMSANSQALEGNVDLHSAEIRATNAAQYLSLFVPCHFCQAFSDW